MADMPIVVRKITQLQTSQNFDEDAELSYVELSTASYLLLESDLPPEHLPEEAELDGLKCSAEIAERLLQIDGAWVVIYFRKDLGKLFIGRDVFGRFSLLFATDSASTITIACASRPSNKQWKELPHGQVTVLDVEKPFEKCAFFSYFDCYAGAVDEQWLGNFALVDRRRSAYCDAMLKVSPTISDPDIPAGSSCAKLNSLLKEACRLLTPPSCESVAVGFSGGVDSTLLTRILHMSLPPQATIDLINVAFGDSEEVLSSVPDRQRAVRGVKWLRAMCQGRKFRLILVDVDTVSLEKTRAIFVSCAARPSNTVLDESICCVLWFMLRGVGKDYDTGEVVRTRSKLRFVGSGADELFAGYARHRNRFEVAGPACVANECELELRRLGIRNGGRDGRMAAQLGVQLRAPYLATEVVRWANGLPMQEKAQLDLPRGQGEKIIIRKTLADMTDAQRTFNLLYDAIGKRPFSSSM